MESWSAACLTFSISGREDTEASALPYSVLQLRAVLDSLPHLRAVLYRLLELRPALHSLRLTSHPGAVMYSPLHLRVVNSVELALASDVFF